MSENKAMSPFLKWAGGKSQILNLIAQNMPNSFNRYYEPFIGSGAVLLSFAPENAFINDINEPLINAYRQIKLDVEAVISEIAKLDSAVCDKELYYELRKRFNDKLSSRSFDAGCAALMIWLNKHCFNGLFRVNSKGLFNVPYNNRRTGKSADEENLRAISRYLNSKNVTITCEDFFTACENVNAGDFVYFDSPYLPVSETAYFTDYTKSGFAKEDHERLADTFRELNERGAKLMLSNNDVPVVYELYKGFNIRSFDVKRMINSVASKRVGKEVLVTNY